VARRVDWAEAAWRDFEEAASYIARDSKYYAASFVKEVIEATRTLSLFTSKGRVVPELANPNYREVIVQSYRVIYQIPDENSIEILAVVHGARDLWILWHRESRG